VPSRGAKKQLVDIVAENASRGLQQLKIKQLSSPVKLEAAMEEIKRELDLPYTPSRMEGYDISNIQGRTAVGSMVVFYKGKPQKAYYRRFKINTVPTADDYAMLHEVILRRFGHFKSDTSSDTSSWAVIPDLILIDGGRGQLNSVLKAMNKMGVESIPVISIAKESEQIFSPKKLRPIILSHTSPGLQLLQRLRDEAHRFAIDYHRHIRKRQSLTSALDSVPGIGHQRKRNLLRQFGSVSAIKEATLEDLVATNGINLNIASRIREYL
jgi:excinuclease ABC subunit C